MKTRSLEWLLDFLIASAFIAAALFLLSRAA